MPSQPNIDSRTTSRPKLAENSDEKMISMYSVGMALQISLKRSIKQAEQGADHRDDESEHHRQAKAVQQPRQQVAAAVVGAEQVVAVGRRRTGVACEVVDGAVVIGVERIPGEIARLRQVLADQRIEVVGRRGKVTAESGLRERLEHREIPVPLVASDQGLVVRQHFGEQAEAEKEREYQHAHIAEAVAAEAAPGAPRRAFG